MSKGLDAFANRYQQIGRMRLEVPELDLDMWFSPFTMLDQQELDQAGHSIDSVEGMVWTIIRKAEDANGERLFDVQDGPRLKRVAEVSLLKAIVIKLVTSDGTTPEEK